MGRVDMGDHIKARLRHFRGAVARNDLDGFLHKEILLPDEETMNRIAEEIRTTKENGDFYAMLYLTRCAVRDQVNSICFDIVANEWDVAKLGETDPMSMHDVVTFADAKRAISRFFLDVDWDDVCGFAVGPPPTTQERLRSPFDLGPYMADRRLAKYVFDTLGISSPAN
jgi:hypothetical protein